MGLFNFFNKDDKSENAVQKPVVLSPKDKPYEWFRSEEGLKCYDEYMIAKNFSADETYIKEFEEKGSKYYDIFIEVCHKEHKSPKIFFESLVTAVGKVPGCSDSLLYTAPIKLLADLLTVQARPFYFNDDGDPIPVDPKPDGKLIVSIESNPVLKFAFEFGAYKFENDDLDWQTMIQLWKTALLFVSSEVVIHGNYDVLKENSWLLEKETYVTALGTLRTEKGFLKTGVEKSTRPEFFTTKLEKE